MASWTLWQALPPRYQLTCKDIAADDECINSPSSCPPKVARPTTPRQSTSSPRIKSASVTASPRRGYSRIKSAEATASSRNTNIVGKISGQGLGINESTQHSKNYGSPASSQDKSVQDIDITSQTIDVPASPRGRAMMYFTVTSPRGKPSEWDRKVIAKSSFPPRRSSFIDSFKQQQLINSMRQSFEDPSTASPRSVKHSTNAPHFPVTQITPERNDACENGRFSEKPRAKTATSVRKTHSGSKQANTESISVRRNHRKSIGTDQRQQELFVNTILPFDTSIKPFLRNPLYLDKPSKRYVVRKLDDATMFIDDDKIIFIKKKTTKNDILQCQKSADDANYLQHLRKLYLREPKDIAKFKQNTENNKKTLMRERLEYDQRTDNILNYYSRIDDRENAFAWAMSIENVNRNKDSINISRSPRAHSSPGMRRENSSKPQTPRRDRPATSRSFRQVNGSELYTNHDALSDWNVFVKFNSQSILHDRQFYLQTPMLNPDSKAEIDKREGKAEDCECRLCRLEMELKNQTQKEGEQEHSTIDNKGTNNDRSSQPAGVDSNGGQEKEENEGGDESEVDQSNELETLHLPINTKIDKATSTSHDVIEKATINLTIDLSTQIIDSSEINSKDENSDNAKYPTQTMEEINSGDPKPHYVTETNPVAILTSHKRGEEGCKETKDDDVRGKCQIE